MHLDPLKRICVCLPSLMVREVRNEALRQGTTFAAIVRQAVADYLAARGVDVSADGYRVGPPRRPRRTAESSLPTYWD